MLVDARFLQRLYEQSPGSSSSSKSWGDDDVGTSTASNPVRRRLFVVLFTNSKTMTAYKRYKAHFVAHVLRTLRPYIHVSSVYFLHEDQRTLQRVDVSNRNEEHKSLLRFCRWIRFCQQHGSMCSLFPPSHTYLYPNMKVDSGNRAYEEWKMSYAMTLKEITLLWKCHPTHRERVHAQGILGFDDPKFDTGHLKLSKKDEDTLQRMLALHRSSTERIDIPCPQIVWNAVRPMDMACYVDFETYDGFIYWIGIGYTHPETRAYEYEAIVATSRPDLTSEKDVMLRFVQWMDQWEGYSKTVYYWFAEIRFWHDACKRHHHPSQQEDRQDNGSISSLSSSSFSSSDDDDDEDPMYLNMDDWVDLHALFRDAPILVRNAWNFKLKTVAKWMREYGMVEIALPRTCQSGQESMTIAEEYFHTMTEDLFEILRAYNHFDCTVMYEMVVFLQNHVQT